MSHEGDGALMRMLRAKFNPLKLKGLTRILDRKQSDDHARCMLDDGLDLDVC